MTELEPIDIVLGIGLSVLVIGAASQYQRPAQAETPSRFHVWRVEHNGPLGFNLVHDAADGRCYVVTSQPDPGARGLGAASFGPVPCQP